MEQARTGSPRQRWSLLADRLLKLLGGSTPPASRVSGFDRDPPGDDEGILRVSATERYARSRWNFARLLRYVVFGERPEPIASYTGLVERAEAGKIGIACSGGGIRSAAFNLGALQVLQEKGVLKSASYLAGVSGGSYIAAAFCMVRRTWAGGIRPEKPQAGWDDSDPAMVTSEHPAFFRGSPEEQYLRNHASYLAPGAFGKIRFGYRLVLGMGLNMLFIGLALVAAALPLALLYGALYPQLARHVGPEGLCGPPPMSSAPNGGAQPSPLCHISPLHVPMGLWVPVAVVAAAAIAISGAAIVAYRWPSSLSQIAEVLSLRLLLLAVVAGVLLIGLPVLLSLFRAWGTATHLPSAEAAANGARPEAAGGVSRGTGAVVAAGGILTLGGAVLLQLRADWAQARQLANDVAGLRKWYAKLAPGIRRLLANLIAVLVGPALALALILAASSRLLNFPHPWTRWVLTGGVVAFFWLVYAFADMTTWSLHSFYRRRLCWAFALKRVSRSLSRNPPIADEDAGEAVERNYHELVTLSHTGIEPDGGGRRDWPTLLVCAAANISDTAATPPGRAVTSFTFSSTSMGGPLVGAVRTEDLEKACDRTRQSYFTLPAAVAMSGAAISPSMGKMTRWPLRFLMTLANVRLGVWVPNPRKLSVFASRKRFYPKPRASYLLREVLGLNPLNGPYLYVTDGGHYENLGIVELLRRGCTEIYCFDASNDNFDAIGDAISLARSELNVEIDDINYEELQVSNENGLAQKSCVSAPIEYPGPGAPKARLYYARLAMTPDAPLDAAAYSRRDRRFPHDPTADQFYTDQRFEAYRALGIHAARAALTLKGQDARTPAIQAAAGGGDGMPAGQLDARTRLGTSPPSAQQ